MTIKQQGGIFGRNPSFNSIELDGTDLETTLDGKADLTGDTFTGTVNVSTSGNAEINATRASGSSARMQAQSARAVIGTTTNHELRFIANNTQYVNLSTAGDLSVMSGNLVISTSGKGIDFSATSGTGTSELFSDYEEGNWTPAIGTISGYTGALTVTGATYTKIGNVVTVRARVGFFSATGVITGGDQIAFTGLPFSAATIGGFYDYNYAVCTLSQSEVRRGTMDGVMTGATTFQVQTSNVTSATARNATLIGISFSYRSA
jgi:hypothetical protein